MSRPLPYPVTLFAQEIERLRRSTYPTTLNRNPPLEIPVKAETLAHLLVEITDGRRVLGASMLDQPRAVIRSMSILVAHSQPLPTGPDARTPYVPIPRTVLRSLAFEALRRRHDASQADDVKVMEQTP